MSTWEASSPPRLSFLADRRRIFARPPAALTSLVGREQELALATNLLRRDDVRLLTITGPGGIGKTRLAIEIARNEADAFPDGVAFVPLAAVPGPGQVMGVVRRALDIQEPAGTDARDNLVAVLSDASALLVLDNFEHLLDAAPLLTDLLAACDHLKIVVTSRALLRLSGEYALPVPPLALPDPAATNSSVYLGETPSVQLFVERIRATKPSFALTEETASLAADICRYLDGLPLAIELAAAQATILPLAALLKRIRARLPLPVMGPRDAPTRLRSINDAVAWSYDLLTDDEKRLMRWVSVFAGGFSLEAAEHLIRAAGREGGEEHRESASAFSSSLTTLEGISALVEKNLLRHEDREDDPRFAMLETIRAFAWDQLVSNGEADKIGDAHADWVIRIAERYEMAFILPEGERDLERLEVEHPNVLTALNWLERRENIGGMLRLAAALGGFWITNNHYQEGRDWLERALAATPEASNFVRGRAELGLARIISQFGEAERAYRLLADGIARLDRTRDALWVASGLSRQGTLALQLGQYDRAETLLHETLQVASTVPDELIAAAIEDAVVANLGVVAEVRGDLDKAVLLHEQALQNRRRLGYTLGIVRSLRDLGDVERDRGDLVRSVTRYREALEPMGDRTDLRVVVDALEGAAMAAAAWRQPQQAARLLGMADKFRVQLGGEFLVPTARMAYERTLAVIQLALNESEIAAARIDAQHVTVSKAIEAIRSLALSEEPVTIAISILSPREVEVLRQLVAGLPDRAIAETLYISVRTVEAHVAKILNKLGVRTRTAAVSAAMSAGLIELNLGPDKARD